MRSQWDAFGSELEMLLCAASPRTRERVRALYVACRTDAAVRPVDQSPRRGTNTDTKRNPPQMGGEASGGPVFALSDAPLCVTSWTESSAHYPVIVAGALDGSLHAISPAHGSWHAPNPAPAASAPWDAIDTANLAPCGAALCVDSMPMPGAQESGVRCIIAGTGGGAVLVYKLRYVDDDAANKDNDGCSLSPLVAADQPECSSTVGLTDADLIMVPWSASMRVRRSPLSSCTSIRSEPRTADDTSGQDRFELGNGVGSMILSASDSRSSLGTSSCSSPADDNRRGRPGYPSLSDPLPADSSPSARRRSSPFLLMGSFANVGASGAGVTAVSSFSARRGCGIVGWGTRDGLVFLSALDQLCSFNVRRNEGMESKPQMPHASWSVPPTLSSDRCAAVTQIQPASLSCDVIAAATWDGFVWVLDARAGPRPVLVAPPYPSKASTSVRAWQAIAGLAARQRAVAATAEPNAHRSVSRTMESWSSGRCGAAIKSLCPWDSASSESPSAFLTAAADGMIRLLDTRRFLSTPSDRSITHHAFNKAQCAAAEVWALRAGHRPVTFACTSVHHRSMTVCFKDMSVKTLVIHSSRESGDGQMSKRGGGDLQEAHHLKMKRGATGLHATVAGHIEVGKSAAHIMGGRGAWLSCATAVAEDCGDSTPNLGHLVVQGISGGLVALLSIDRKLQS